MASGRAKKESFVRSVFVESELPQHKYLQESDLYKPLMLDIGESGLNYVYHKYFRKATEADLYKCTKTKKPINVIIIGAGISGLVAAYELAQVGHKVTILEMQHRVGGKVKTIGDSHFQPGLWADSGAMRVPGNGKPGWDKEGPCHYLTDFYVNHFQLPTIPFLNSDPDDCTYFKFYDDKPIQKKEWSDNCTMYCDKYWPGWDKKLLEVEEKKKGFRNMYNITDIDSYFDATIAPLVKQLDDWLKIDPVAAWEEWVAKWSFFSLEQFLRSSFEQVKHALDRIPDSRFSTNYDEDLVPLPDLLPWPQEAVIAYSTFTYILPYQLSLIEYLRDSSLGKWWKEPMYTLKDGLRMLPEAFMKERKSGWNKEVDLSKSIVFGVAVQTIEYSKGSVEVFCRNNTTQHEVKFKGDRVIITVPINVFRGIKFKPPLDKHYYQVFENLNTISGTKIMIQCRTRFWQKDGIQGGCSTTNMPIGRMFYQSNPGLSVPEDERGILLCYTWKSEALIFGAHSDDNAIAEAVKQIAEIHPEVKDQFEVGAIQSWYNDPAAQGCSTFLQPEETNLMRILMDDPPDPIYIGGEGVSFTNGWIQGALESGLRAAYQLYKNNESAMTETYKKDI